MKLGTGPRIRGKLSQRRIIISITEEIWIKWNIRKTIFWRFYTKCLSSDKVKLYNDVISDRLFAEDYEIKEDIRLDQQSCYILYILKNFISETW